MKFLLKKLNGSFLVKSQINGIKYDPESKLYDSEFKSYPSKFIGIISKNHSHFNTLNNSPIH